MLPSSKVTTQFLVGLVLAVAAYLAQDMSWLDSLPGWVGPVVAPLLAMLAGYQKAENRPAPSSLK